MLRSRILILFREQFKEIRMRKKYPRLIFFIVMLLQLGLSANWVFHKLLSITERH